MQLCHFHVVLGRGRFDTEPIKAEPGGHRRQPTGKVGDLLIGAVEPEPGLLDDVLRLCVVPEHPTSEAHQARSLGFEGEGRVHDRHILPVGVVMIMANDVFMV